MSHYYYVTCVRIFKIDLIKLKLHFFLLILTILLFLITNATLETHCLIAKYMLSIYSPYKRNPLSWLVPDKYKMATLSHHHTNRIRTSLQEPNCVGCVSIINSKGAPRKQQHVYQSHVYHSRKRWVDVQVRSCKTLGMIIYD